MTEGREKDYSPGWWMEQVDSAVRYKRYHSDWERWPDYQRYYRAQFVGFDGDIWTPDAILPFPLIRTIINTIIPNVFMQNPYISASPGVSPMPPFTLHLIEGIINWILDEIDFEDEMYHIIFDALVCGKGIAKTIYDSEYGWSQDNAMLELGDAGTTNTQYSKYKNKDERIEYRTTVKPGMPSAIRVDPNEWFVPFGARSLNDAMWFDHVIIRNLADLQQDGKYKNVSDLKGSHVEASIMGTYLRNKIDSLGREQQWIEFHEIHEKKHGQVMAVVDELGQNSVLGGRFIRGPEEDGLQVEGLPAVELSFDDDPELYWPRSVAAVLEPIQLEINDTRTQIMHLRRISVLKILVRRGIISQDEADKLLSGRMGAMIFADGPVGDDALRIFQPHLTTDLPYHENNSLEAGREAVGLSRQLMGQQSGGRKTAREVSLTVQGSALQLDHKRYKVAKMIERVARKLLQLVYTYWDQSKIVQVVGMDGARYWVNFSPDAIKGEYKLKVDVDSLSPPSKEMRKQDVMALIQALGNNPAVNIQYLVQMLGKQFEWLDMMQLFPMAPENMGGQSMQANEFQSLQQRMLSEPQFAQTRAGRNAPQIQNALAAAGRTR